MNPAFTAHNIRLDDGSYTRPGDGAAIDNQGLFLSSKRLIESLFGTDLAAVRLVDLACLEGGYTVEFARMGLDTLGIEVRDSNIAACNYIKERVSLPNLRFVQDDVRNLKSYGSFEIVFCSGILYHLENPFEYLELLGAVTTKLLIVNTHYSVSSGGIPVPLPVILRQAAGKFSRNSTSKYILSSMTEHEGFPGRWYTEFRSDRSLEAQESNRWASWNNRKSFWPTREALIEGINRAGFDIVLEQFDHLGPRIAQTMQSPDFKALSRGTFIGIKSGHSAH